MCLHFLAVLLHPRDMSLPYFCGWNQTELLFLAFWSVSTWCCSFLPIFFSLVDLPRAFGIDWVQIWFLVWSVQTPEAFLSPLPLFRGFKHMSTYLPIEVSTSHSLDLKRVIRSHISVEVRHVLKFSSVLNWYFLELEPTYFSMIHFCPSTYIYCKLFCNTYMAQYVYGSGAFPQKSPIDTSHT